MKILYPINLAIIRNYTGIYGNMSDCLRKVFAMPPSKVEIGDSRKYEDKVDPQTTTICMPSCKYWGNQRNYAAIATTVPLTMVNTSLLHL
jgi:hypothetical protein